MEVWLYWKVKCLMKHSLAKRISSRIHYLKYFNPKKLEVTFIVSTGRTGTKFFEDFITLLDDNIYAVHEPKPDFFDLGINKIRQNLTSETVKKEILKGRERNLKNYAFEGKKAYLESNPFLVLILDELKEVFPKAKFIFIFREPKSYVKSALNKTTSFSDSTFMYDKNDARKRLSAKDYIRDKYFNLWDGLSRIEKISWYWNKCNLILLDFFYKNQEKTLCISFENFFSKNEKIKKKELYKISSFIGINIDELKMDSIFSMIENKKNSNDKIVFDGFEIWNDDVKSSFHSITNETSELIQGILNN